MKTVLVIHYIIKMYLFYIYKNRMQYYYFFHIFHGLTI